MGNQNEWQDSFMFRHARKNQFLDAVRGALGRDPSPDAMVFFVHTSRGKSNNDGSVGAPINNIHTALAKCRNDRDDCVVVLPGSAITATATVTTSALGALGESARSSITVDPRVISPSVSTSHQAFLVLKTSGQTTNAAAITSCR